MKVCMNRVREVLDYNTMWFLGGRPTGVNVDALLTSVSGGYQQTDYRFTVNSESEKLFIAIAFPWCTNREDGSLEFVESAALDGVCPAENVQVIGKADVDIWERLRSLKMIEGSELALVQEMITWYLDDIGVMTLWIESGKTYQLSYRHKIAADSKLYFPTKMSVFINKKTVEFNYRIWTVDAMLYDLPRYLKKGSTTPEQCSSVKGVLNRVEFADGFNWDDDFKVSTDNWDSTDDECESDSEELSE